MAHEQVDTDLSDLPAMDTAGLRPGLDRRAFILRSAVASAQAPAAPTPQAPPLSPDLQVVKKAKGPVMTTLDEFYKGGPGPSSSHTIGPMRITSDFYQRCTKLPSDQLAKAAVERCAFGAVKSWTGFMIASNEIPPNRRVDFDTTVEAMALTAREMNSKYKKTSEGGLAVSVTLC
jgi:Serine dehydratase alpha chain/Serine dehydratase beta chain